MASDAASKVASEALPEASSTALWSLRARAGARARLHRAVTLKDAIRRWTLVLLVHLLRAPLHEDWLIAPLTHSAVGLMDAQVARTTRIGTRRTSRSRCC